MKEITYYTKSNYGVQAVYVIDETIKKALLRFNGHKTLTQDDKIAFESLGFTFTEVLQPK